MSGFKTHLQLGRVSNLPTVWSNVLAGAVLGGAVFSPLPWALALVAYSLFYIAGMYMNDAFDESFDREHRPERPIPSGQISQQLVRGFIVFYMSFGLLLLGLAHHLSPKAVAANSLAWLLCALVLLAAIYLYNRHHKHNRFSPLIMAACRLLLGVGASYTLSGSVTAAVMIMSVLILCWLIGLTWLAKQEHKSNVRAIWPLLLMATPIIYGITCAFENNSVVLPVVLLTGVLFMASRRILTGNGALIGASIGLLISGISLIDAIMMTLHLGMLAGLAAIICFALTLAGQRVVSGT